MKKGKSKLGEIDFVLFTTVLLLVAIGVVMVYSASAYIALYQFEKPMQFLLRQGAYAFIGLFVMIFTLNMDYHNYRKYLKGILIITFVLLIVVLFSTPVNGARRWINLKVITIQPSELAKYAVVIFLANGLERRGDGIRDFFKGIVPFFGAAAIFAGLVLAEKNLSIATVIMGVTAIMVFVAGARLIHMLVIVSGLGMAVVAGIIFEPYRMARLMNFMNPWKDPQGKGYQLIQSLYALGSGGVLGVGIGQSRQKCFYIPEPHNDFIFSVIGEELGLVGCIFIIVLYIILISRGVRTAIRAKDTYGALLASGITSVVAVQAIINIAVVSGSMPVTGVPLPFISYGGSALIFNMFAMGILLNISRQAR